MRKQRVVDQDVTLERLRQQRQRLREQLAPKEADRLMSRRYQARAGKDIPLPKARVEQDMPRHEKRPEAKPSPDKPGTSPEASHLQQLLDAKRKAKEKREDKD